LTDFQFVGICFVVSLPRLGMRDVVPRYRTMYFICYITVPLFSRIPAFFLGLCYRVS